MSEQMSPKRFESPGRTSVISTLNQGRRKLHIGAFGQALALWPTFTETAPTAAAGSSKDAGCIGVRIRSENRMVSNSNNRRAVRWEDACQDFRV